MNSLFTLVLEVIWFVLMLRLAVLLLQGLKYCTTCLYNRISYGRVRLTDEEETTSTPTLFQRNIIHPSYQNDSIRNNVNYHTFEPIYVHHQSHKKAATDRKQYQQLPLIIKNIPTETIKQVPHYPFGGSTPQAFKKCLIVTQLENKSTPNSTESTKKPPSPPHKVAPSHAIITLQTSSRCINCNQIFTETNPLLRVSKGNHLHCVGCRRFFFEAKKKNRTIQSLQKMMLFQGQDKAFMYTRALSRSNRDFLHTEKCRIYAERLRANMIQRRKEFCKNQVLNKRNGSKQRNKKKIKNEISTGEDDDMVTVQQLVEIMRRSESKCAITRLTGVWSPSFPTHPFRLTVDHIVPICKGGSFAVTNLQITFRCINQLKGHYHNSHLVEFVNGYKEVNKNTT